MYSWFSRILLLIVGKTRTSSNRQNHGSKTKDQPWKWRESYSSRETADQVGCSQSVSNILKKPQLTRSVKDLKIPGQKKENYEREDSIMVRTACPIALRLHRKIKQRCRLNMVRVSLLPLPDDDWERLVPTVPNQVTICATSEQFFLTVSVHGKWFTWV